MLRPRLNPERSCVCCRSRRRLGRLRASTRVAPQSRSRSLSLSERTEKPPLAASSYCARGIACSESCLSGLFPSARTDQDGPQWVKCGRQIRPWTDFAPSPGSASASNRASKAVVRQVCNTSTPSPSRKERSFRDGLVNGSYPTLCCPSRSLRYGRTAPQRAVQEVRLFPIDGQHTQPLDSIPAVAAC